MFKPVSPRSVATISGLFVAVSGLFLMSQTATTTFFPSARLQYGPQPRDFVRIQEGTPYVVPAGKCFVLSCFGSAEASGDSVTVTRNGVAIVGTTTEAWYGFPASLRPTPSSLAFQAGDLIDVQATDPGPDGRAWGYLSDAATSVPVGTWRPSLEFSPAPQNGVLVREGTPYTVPAGMLCIVTAVGTTTSPPTHLQVQVHLLLNGQNEAEVNVYPGEFSHSSLVELAPGCVFPAGSVLSVDAVNPAFTGEALLFLATP